MEGKPWRDRACSFDAADCWGLVVMYYRHVLGIEIHQTPDYEAGSDFLTCFTGDIVFWKQAEKASDSSIFIAYYGAEPKHVGLVVNGQAFQVISNKDMQGGSPNITLIVQNMSSGAGVQDYQ
ncbi:hypothetical protein PSTG_18168, partial [Puccinia striiformis f. sp. tritici PST-78]